MITKDQIDLEFNKNEDKMKLMLAELKKKLSKIHLGGGQKHRQATR